MSDETARQWVVRVMLDELDAIIDERAKTKDASPAAREAGRRAMRERIEPMVNDEARAESLRRLGESDVRAGVRRMYQRALS